VSGSRIKKVIDEFGGSERVKVQFPARNDNALGGDEANTVFIKAHESQIQALRTAIIEVVNEILTGDEPTAERQTFIDSEVVDTVEDSTLIPKSEVSRIIGRGSEGLKEIMRTHKVLIWITDSEDDESNATVRVVAPSGSDDLISAALEEIKVCRYWLHFFFQFWSNRQ
jgi:hypothetical protein